MGRSASYSTLTSCARIGVGDLQRHGLLQPGCESRWPFTGGGTSYTVVVTAFPESVRFEAGDVKTTVCLKRVPMRFGGTRTWFFCPSCGARRGMMFLGSSTWSCRVCFRLKYPSSREDRHGRLGTKLAKTMRRLGAKWNDNPLFTPKPKWQRWPTYERLVDEARRVENARVMELVAGSKWASLDHLMRRSLGK